MNRRHIRYFPWRPLVLAAAVAGPWALVALGLSLGARVVYLAVFADEAVRPARARAPRDDVVVVERAPLLPFRPAAPAYDARRRT